METQDMPTKQLNDLTIDDRNDINILLLGETGVGKSTFINSIANYLHFEDFKVAEKAKPLVLISSTLTVRDLGGKLKVIKICGGNKNECPQIGESATQDIRTYVFPIGDSNVRLRIIDTPGIGNPKGIKYDDLNCENILSYLNNVQKLHAICFLMKPNDENNMKLFKYCIKQIFSRLEILATRNLIFIFTHTRETNYTDGDTLQDLQKAINEINKTKLNIEIPLKNNIFCFDNEGFRFQILIMNNIKILAAQQAQVTKSWNISSRECLRMISYIMGDLSKSSLKLLQIKNSECISEARQLMLQLQKPLVDTLELIDENIILLEYQYEELLKSDQTLNELKKKLYVPVVSLEVIKLKQPVTVCADIKCLEIYKVGDFTKWHYTQKCHDPCNLKTFPTQIIGDPGLTNFDVMDDVFCKICGCDLFAHMHVYYLTKTVDDKIMNDNIEVSICDQEQFTTEVNKTNKQIQERIEEYKIERLISVQHLKAFNHFLASNSLTPYNDSCGKYIEYFQESAHRLKFNKYNFWNLYYGKTSINYTSLKKSVRELYLLKHTGKKIQELFESQKIPMEFEYNRTVEYFHPIVGDKIDDGEIQ